ncbi:MAG TPA: FecR family protein [Spirochaetota bacterium]|nr:FecR family protein [Spirochaetota bacterium]HPJ36257.1 FecR family protein [Spirochaetota bacterium]
MEKKITLIYIISLIFIISSCSKKAGPIEGEVTFLTGSLKINNIDASVGSPVVKDDVLLTGEKSEAVIQVSETAVITLRSETTVKFGDLIRNKDQSYRVAMELNKGETFHKVIKKGTDYTVKAPTAVASVRGTSFDMSAKRAGTRISVETGTVYVRLDPETAKRNPSLTDKQNNGEEEIILNAGESLEIAALSGGGYYSGKSGYNKPADSLKRTDMDPARENTKNTSGEESGKNTAVTEKKTGTTTETIAKTVRDSDTKTVNKKIGTDKTALKKTSDINKASAEKKGTVQVTGKKSEEKTPDPEKVKELVSKKSRKLEEIKDVYSRIDKVYLYSGEVITGAIIKRGDTYSVLTTEGIVKVPKKNIQSNEIIK